MQQRLAAAGRNAVALVPPIGRLRSQRNQLALELEQVKARAIELEDVVKRVGGAPTGNVRMAFPAGHFYSPIPDLDDLVGRDAALFGPDRRLPGIDLAPERQLGLLERFAALYSDLPYPETGSADGLRYQFDNPFFSYGDGIAYYSMLRTLTPSRILEVGSGWSSALALDVDEQFLGGNTRMTFIEPYPDRLDALLQAGDSTRAEIVARPLRDADPTLFDQLGPGDILFIDSTHVSRVGSDVNQLVLEILPALGSGVHVHVHDIFFPFEYPKEWVLDGRAWNENYLLHAFFIQNDHVRINWFNSYLAGHHREAVTGALPLWGRNPGGSIWFETA
ncbi:class I SAM-dependent methyltransferase [Desertimonas flava]|uniref:class I SAM-dependent methyltransferase n=1 Tax=Desertimonas flava TaxID=2064846 RepID=UPI001968A8BB|nr:class I SAM-dependent methyltransferase [Desertimonas flava]